MPPAVFPPGYHIESIPVPEGIPFEVTGLDFAANGTLYLCTRDGDVWTRKVENSKPEWHIFARGLQEPLGVLVDKKPGHIFVSQRPELTELVDEDGDGTADLYRRINGDWGFDGNYHEFAHGPVRDAEGNLYVALNLGHGGPGGVRGSTMTHPSPWRGWVVQITPDGKFVPYASGFRSPVGLAVNDKNEIFIMDSQGDWVATSPLFQLVKDRFYLHPSSLADRADFAGRDLNKVPIADFKKMTTAPVLWVPYGELANCPAQPVFDYTHGKFGPFENQIFFGDQTKCNMMRATIEKIGGEYQGTVYNFGNGLQSGYIRGAFAPDGSLWMGEVDHGWGVASGKPWGFERLSWDGHTTPFEIDNIHLTPTGFKVSFTKPVNAEAAASAASYELKHWHYDYHPAYGSNKFGEAATVPTQLAVSSDAKSVDIQMPLIKGEVYQITAKGVRSQTGESLTNSTGWYTLNRLLQP